MTRPTLYRLVLMASFQSIISMPEKLEPQMMLLFETENKKCTFVIQSYVLHVQEDYDHGPDGKIPCFSFLIVSPEPKLQS